jgi:glycerophosphoryl diester phosphodiesterase
MSLFAGSTLARQAPTWLTARPIAHRGLHAAEKGIIENTIAAADAAIAHGFAIECDIQRTADGEAVVFHDFTFDRLTTGRGRLDAAPMRFVETIGFRATGDRIPTLRAFLERIGGRVPLICEVKSRFDGDMRLADRAAAVAAAYDGPLAFKSFDPAVMAHLRAADPAHAVRPLGMCAEANYADPDYALLTADRKRALANFLHYRDTRPDFVSYAVYDLPHAVPFLCRVGIGLPVMTWTVRTPDERRAAADHADQMVFEGFVP